MAMLVLPDVFERTWGRRAPLFWPEATRRVREVDPDFSFMAEVYWDLEWTMQQQGFDYTYDKRLYDRLRDGHARPVREHLHAGLDYQNKLARFLENHDEPRAAATFAPAMHKAAAVVTFLSPGLRFFHQGQFEGRRKRISPHLVRGPAEPPDSALQRFYERLLSVLRLPAVRDGGWQLLECDAGVGRKLDGGLFRRFALAGRGRRTPPRGRQLRREPEPVLRAPAAARRWSRPVRFEDLMGAGGFDREDRRSRRTRAVPRPARLGLPHIRYRELGMTAE